MPIGGNTRNTCDYEGRCCRTRPQRQRFVIITSSVSGKKDHFLNYISADVLIWKKRAEEALMASGLEYVVVGPAAINDDPGGRKPIRMIPREKYQAGMAINRDDLATVVIAAAALPSAANRTFSVANGSGAATADWSRVFATLPAK